MRCYNSTATAAMRLTCHFNLVVVIVSGYTRKKRRLHLISKNKALIIEHKMKNLRYLGWQRQRVIRLTNETRSVEFANNSRPKHMLSHATTPCKHSAQLRVLCMHRLFRLYDQRDLKQHPKDVF
jgi:hypothetical protein